MNSQGLSGRTSDTCRAAQAATSLYDVRRNRVRWLILSLLFVLYTLTFMDKSNISAVAPAIAREFHLDKATMGLIFGSFGVAAAIGQIPAGWLADRWGSRRVLTGCVAAWSVLTALTALATGFGAFCSVRFLTGLAESGAFPAGTRAVKPWFSRQERGVVQGIPHLFGRLGTAITPLLAVWLTLLFGWRGVFYAFGAAGLVWAALFYWAYRDVPQTHPWLRGEERRQVLSIEEDHADAYRQAVPWRKIFASGTTWGLVIGAGAYTYCIFFYTTWLPTYLVEYRHFSLGAMGVLASAPLVAGMAGDVLGGVLTDRILKRTGRLGFARKAVVVPAFLLSAVALVPAALAADPFVSVLCLSISLFCMETLTGPWWAVPLDVGGRFSGTVTGVMNTSSNIGGALSPVVFGLWAQSGDWISPFLVCAGLLVVGAVAWIFLVRPDRQLFD